MQLKDYLVKKDLTTAEFAASVEVTKFAVRKWLRGERTPRPKIMVKIKKATKGAVSPDDWMQYTKA